MPEITAIASVLSSVKSAIDLAKTLRDVDIKIAQGGLKLRVAELMDSLADAKTAAIEFQDVLAQKDAEIAVLKKLGTFTFTAPFFIEPANGTRCCPRCFQRDQKAVFVVGPYAHSKRKEEGYECPSCDCLYFNDGSGWQIQKNG